MTTSISYVKVFADNEGNSHLEEGLTLQLEPTNFVPPAPAIHVSPLRPAVSYAFLSVPVGYFGDWHPSPKRQWLFFISGQMEFEVSDGARYLGVAGSRVLLEDITGRSSRLTTTMQVDFQMPGRLGAEYVAADDTRAPQQSYRRRARSNGSGTDLTPRDSQSSWT
jgi:hypothetical protein